MTERLKMASVLTIGTEITSGEIINSNAAWISRNLVDHGFVIDQQISVADDRDSIQRALQACIETSATVIVTGGLGPTTDDFTREEIAKFIKRPLKWEEASWQRIVTRLNSLNAPIAESNKQQCWFPEGAEILTNREGTAAGFAYKDTKRDFDLIVLPGPPKEIDAIWRDHVDGKLQSRVPNDQRTILKRWITMGLSESKLGEIVEDALKDSGFTTGYRSRIPYIDVKVWIPVERMTEFQSQWNSKLEESIAKWLVGREDDDLAVDVWKACPSAIPIYIVDRVTCGLFASRIFSHEGPAGKQITVLTSDYATPLPPLPQTCNVITITAKIETGAWRIDLTGADEHKTFSEVSRYKSAAHADRLKRYVCERSLQTLVSWW